jgi:hypothetical protein
MGPGFESQPVHKAASKEAAFFLIDLSFFYSLVEVAQLVEHPDY